MKNNQKIRIFLVVAGIVCTGILSYTLNGHSSKQTAIEDIPKKRALEVTASFYPLYYFASEIGGENVRVYNITPAGAEPHDYEPTSRDIVRIEKSNLLILNGRALEPWSDKIKNALEGKKVIVITAGDNIATQKIKEDGGALQDPHVWLDPVLAKEEVRSILQGFVLADPKNAPAYESNSRMLQQSLDTLHKEYQEGLNDCKKRDIVTSHAAFGYLAGEYHLRQISISGLSPDEEPSAKKLSELTDFVRKNNIQHIFFESLVSPKLSETIAHEVGVSTLLLNPIEGLSDEEKLAGKNYFTLMRQNLTNLRTALQCR